jgi:hypothetical protein
MSIDQYSRHANDDESGLVPAQTTPPADPPRKIRSLSTDDLDRLTIDSAGRFYWDGQLVNYGFAKPDGQLIDPRELSSLASPHQETTTGGNPMADPAPPTKDATLDAIAEALAAATPVPGETPTVVVAAPVIAAPVVAAPAATPEPAPAAPREPIAREPIALPVPVAAGPRRFKLSFFQSIGALLGVLALLLAGAGLAASGFATAHEYGCRAGLVTAYCPPKPVAPPRPRGIID